MIAMFLRVLCCMRGQVIEPAQALNLGGYVTSALIARFNACIADVMPTSH